jgi:hypothetical protein
VRYFRITVLANERKLTTVSLKRKNLSKENLCSVIIYTSDPDDGDRDGP